jgi:hypothetical protein
MDDMLGLACRKVKRHYFTFWPTTTCTRLSSPAYS